MDQRTLLGLIDAIYEAALDANLWPQTLIRLADSIGASDAALGILSDKAPPMLIAPRTDPAYSATYAACYHQLNLFWLRLQSHPVGQIATDDMLLAPGELHSSRFYQEWSAPQGYHAVMGATLERSAQHHIELQMPSARSFSPDEIELASTLVPHLARAARMTATLAAAQGARGDIVEVLGDLGKAVLVLDTAGHPIDMNSLGEQLLRQSVLHLSPDGALAFADADATKRLHRLVAQFREGSVDQGGRFLVQRSHDTQFAVTIMPLPASARWAFANNRLLMMVEDKDAGQSDRLARFRTSFGLTPAELALTLEIAKGDGREAAARRRGVSTATARAQLTSIFDKTGVRRQAELVRLLHEFN